MRTHTISVHEGRRGESAVKELLCGTAYDKLDLQYDHNKSPQYHVYPYILSISKMEVPEFCSTFLKKWNAEPRLYRIVSHFITNESLLLIHGTGSGKTFAAIAVANCLLHTGIIRNVLVASPKSNVSNFGQQMEKFGVAPDHRYMFVSYGELRRMDPSEYEAKAPFLFVCDESQDINTRGGENAEAAIRCASKARRVLLLSATPFLNYPNELVNQLSLLTRGEVRISRDAFDTLDKDDIVGQFRCLVSVYDRKVDDPDFPKVIEKTIRIEMSPEYEKWYEGIEKQMVKDTKELENSKNVWRFLNGVRRAMNLHGSNTEDNAKLSFVMGVIQDGYDGAEAGQTVVFSSWKAAGTEQLISRLRRLGIKFALIDGDKTVEERNEAVREYNRKAARVLLITNAGGQGLDLVGTRFLIVMDHLWSSAREKQVIGRAARRGSHKSEADKTVYVLRPYLAKKRGFMGWDNKLKSSDEMLMELKAKKQEQSNRFMPWLREASIEEQDTRCLERGPRPEVRPEIRSEAEPREKHVRGRRGRRSPDRLRRRSPDRRSPDRFPTSGQIMDLALMILGH